VSSPSHLYAAQIGDVFWIRVEDKGDMQNSVVVRQAVQAQLQHGVRNIVFDLERCPGMDSTFMGTLTGLARDLKEHGGGRLTVLNVNTRNEQLLTNLGLDHVLEVDLNGSTWQTERRAVSAALEQCEPAVKLDKVERAAHILSAHQSLCEANPDNAVRFKDVIQFLSKDLQSKGA
jgi:anti-sigma B factor antagonist